MGDPNYDDVSVGYLAEKAVSALASLRPSPEVETLIAQLESLYREMGTVGSVLGRKAELTVDDLAQVRMLNKWQGPIWDAVLELRRLASLRGAAEKDRAQPGDNATNDRSQPISTGRCDGRYPVGHQRLEPFDVTYRCGGVTGHEGACGPEAGRGAAEPEQPHPEARSSPRRIWALHCPFTKGTR